MSASSRHSPSDSKQGLKERAEALERDRSFMAAVLDTAGALILVFDREGRIVRFNRTCERTSGRSFASVRGRLLTSLFPARSEADAVREVLRRMAAGDYPGEHEGPWVTPSGERRRIAWSGAALPDDDGRMAHGIWIGLDITDRETAEAELRASEERYRALIENVKDGVGLIHEETVRFANDAMVAMFGYATEAAMTGTNMVELVKPELRGRFRQFLHTALDQRSWGLAFRGQCRRRDGREFWAEILSSAIRHGGDPAILITVRDITENMLWEETIKQEAEYFRSENVRLKSSIGERYRLVDLIGKSPPMQRVYELILSAAVTDASVLIYGRSGTGKELVARAIHELSERAERPFVPVNCNAVPDTLIESELFGYRKGAFTGADSDKAGVLAAAHTGTLFLDEVGDIGQPMQVKLLRALESGEYTPVGERKPRYADVRIVAAINRDPFEMVRAGLLREDFFYRISVIPIIVPPLSDRREDIPLLVEHFLEKTAPEGKDRRRLPVHVVDALMGYDWPGNVRELQNVIQRYLTVGSLDFLRISAPGPDNLGRPAEQVVPRKTGAVVPEPGEDLPSALDRAEGEIIREALSRSRWNRTRAAAALGISRRSLFRRMHRLGL